MPEWGEIFADPEMQRRAPEASLMALLPELKEAGVSRVLDAGCGAGRQLLPMLEAGFRVWGVDRDAGVLKILQPHLAAAPGLAHRVFLARADLQSLPFPAGVFALVVSVNVMNHGLAADFREYCREVGRVLQPGGYLYIYVSPQEFADHVMLPQTRELEPGTLVDIDTPDGDLVHHFPTPQELKDQFPGYRVKRLETVWVPIPFMGNVELPQLVFWASK